MAFLSFQAIIFNCLPLDNKLWKSGKSAFGDISVDGYYHECGRSNAFDFHTTVNVQDLIVCSFYGFYWHLVQKYSIDKLRNRTFYLNIISPVQWNLFHLDNSLRQVVNLEGEFNQLDYFSQTTCSDLRRYNVSSIKFFFEHRWTKGKIDGSFSGYVNENAFLKSNETIFYGVSL